MRGLLHRLAIIASAGTLVAGLGAGIGALSTTAPAFASSTSCGDATTAAPTPAHTGPRQKDPTKYQIPNGTQVYGPCYYWNNTSESHWYMQISYKGSTLYVWVQKLAFGSEHECLDNGNVYGIGSSNCPLFNTHDSR